MELQIDADVARALGGSRLIAGELRGDLAAAREAAGQVLAEARAGAAAGELARAAAQAGAVALLAGDAGESYRLLAESLAADPAGSAAAGARTAFALTCFADRFLMPNGSAGDAATLELRALNQDVIPAEADGGFLLAFARARQAVAAPRSRSLAGVVAALPDVPAGWEPYAALARADLAFGAGAGAEAETGLTDARGRYERTEDHAGVALCELTRADWLLAPAWSPLSWDLPLRTAGITDPLLPEDPWAAIDIEAVRAALELAKQGFALALAPRGLAAVTLREGFLAVREGDPANGRDLALAAEARFRGAGDLTGARLASAHAVLADVAAERPSTSSTAADIGAWGLGEGPFAFAFGIGLLFSGAGRRWSSSGQVDAAVAAQRLAGELFASLGAGFEYVDSRLAQAGLSDLIGDPRHAAEHLEDAAQVVNELLPLMPPDAGALARAEQVAERRRVLCHRLEDPAGLERSRADLQPAREMTLAAARLHTPELAPAMEREFAFADDQDAVTGHIYAAWKALAADRAADYEDGLAEALDYAKAHEENRAALELLVFLATGELEKARAAFETLAPAVDGVGDSDARRSRARAGLLGAVQVAAWDRARRYLDELAAVGGSSWWDADPEPWQGLHDSARVLEGETDWAAAHARYDEAIAALGALRPRAGDVTPSAGGWQPRAAASVYVHAARAALVAAEAGFGDAAALRRRAVEQLEAGKARRLLDLAAAGASAAALQAGHPDAIRWRALTARIGSLLELAQRPEASPADVSALTAARQEQAALEDELVRRDSSWLRVLRPGVPPPDLPAVAETLPSGTALLHYTIGADELIAFAITRDSVIAHREPRAGRKLEAEIARFRTFCSAGASDHWAAAAESLGTVLLAPFDAVLAEHEHLWIVPSRAAYSLPFAALTREREPLLARHTLSILPSASFAPLLGRAPEPTAGPALFVGDPEGMRFPRRGGGAGSEEKGLPWAAAEAAYGAELFGTSAMLGAAASEEAVRGRLQEPHGVVCLSTHGSFEDPALASVLLLAGGQWLSVFELLGIGFATELVVLSACQSGQAVVRPGDEIEGFGAAVLAAGARGSALGLWKVDDRSTALLMSEFFTHLHTGAPPRTALADAQRWLRRLGPDDAAERLRALREAAARAGHDPPAGEETLPSFDHPHHWASFTLLGR